MKKVFTLLTLALLSIGSAWADDVLMVSWPSSGSPTLSNDNTVDSQNGTSNNVATFSNGVKVTIMNSKKGQSNGNNITINGISYKTIKVSNGAQNKLEMPSGKFAYSVDIYGYVNKESSKFDTNYYWKEVNGTSYTEPLWTCGSDGALTTSPDHSTYTLGGVSSFTFNNAGTQLCYVLAITTTPFTSHPVDAAYGLNSVPSALTVTTNSTAGTPTYQWYSCTAADKTGEAAIDGATSASYDGFSTAAVGTYYYFCKMTDNNGTFSSDVATITISAASAPTISAAASATSVYVGSAVTLTATVTGVPDPTIQWYSCDDALKTNPAAIDGATSTTYAPSTATAGTYYFYAVATNSEGSVTSDVIALTVNPLFTVTYSIGDATGVTGTVPASEEVSSSVTLPVNQTLYKEGYTLTGWNDGTTTYAAGASATISANTTMTAVFTANTGELGVCPATVTWQFQTGKGAPSWALENQPAFTYVAQMNLGSETVDMPLTMDPSSGKIANGNWTDWCQLNKGTKLTVPVMKGAVLKLYVYGAPGEGKSATTFDGNTTTLASNIYTYTATATGNLLIVIGEESYYKYLTVTYPMSGVKIYDFATSVGTGVSEDSNVTTESQSINGSSVNIIKFASSLSTGNTKYWKITPASGQFKKGDRIVWTGCYSNSSTKTTTIAIYDDVAISTPIVTGENFANVNGGSASSPKAQTTGYFSLTADAEALYIGRSGGATTYLTGLTVVRENEKATITTADYATFVPGIKVAVPDGVTAYIVSAANSTTATLSPITVIPAGEPVIINKDVDADTEVTFTATDEEASDVSANELKTGAVASADGTQYILANGGSGVGFYQATPGTAIAAGKAYLVSPSGAPCLLFNFFDDMQTTGVNDVRSKMADVRGDFFDLQGRKVANPTKGLYIVNGKKAIVK